MIQTSSLSNPSRALKQAIAVQDHVSALQILQQLPLKNRWHTLFLVQRSFAHNPAKDYLRALTHDLFYRAYRAELAGHYQDAQRLYRLLIQYGGKLTLKARSGYKRIADGMPLLPSTPSPVLSVATVAEHETSLILLAPIPNSQKQPLAAPLAKIIKTDPYTARLTLPSLEFRILRYGKAREMMTLHQSLTTANIPNRHVGLQAIQTIPVHDVLYIESVGDRLLVQVRDKENPAQSLPMTVALKDIRQRIDGLLPLFEEVVDRDKKGKITRKTETQDHAQICDLHLDGDQGILRFYDAGYQFHQGIPLVAARESKTFLETKTSWAQWQGLKQILAQHLPGITEHHKFEHFATKAIEQLEILTQLDAQIRLWRRHDSYWDQAFHLYSALHYLDLKSPQA